MKDDYIFFPIKDLQFSSSMDDREREYAAHFRRDTLSSSVIVLAVFGLNAIGFPLVAFLAPVESDPPAAKYLIAGFIALTSLAGIIVVLARAFGRKQVAHAVVESKYISASGHRNSLPRYYVSVSQAGAAIHVRNVPISHDLYNRVAKGDRVAVVNSPIGAQAYLEE